MARPPSRRTPKARSNAAATQLDEDVVEHARRAPSARSWHHGAVPENPAVRPTAEAADWCDVPGNGVARTRWLAIGDPQTTFARFLEVLRAHDALDASTGALRGEVGLLSIGDHFDFGASGGPEVGAEGLRVLRWLVDHPRDQTVVLLGNHDLARVQELAHETDDTFAAARALALAVRDAGSTPEGGALRLRFHREFPYIPTPEIAARDLSSFSVAQRTLVQALLVARRIRLAEAATKDGRPLLFTHAGLTARELELLGIGDERSPARIAERLQRRLDVAVDAVAPRWADGVSAPLDLAPVHVMGTCGREGGGMLYHRPANPERPGADVRWELDRDAPRRFDPRALPRSLAQVCGHCGHRRCVGELAGWVEPSSRDLERGGLRTLRTDGQAVEYARGLHPARDGEATLWMIDGEIDHVPPERYPLFSFDRPTAP